MLQAFKDGIYGRRYQWIITGIYEDNWWQLDDDDLETLGCTEEQLLVAIDGYISTEVLSLSKNSKTHYGFVSTSLYSPFLWRIINLKFLKIFVSTQETSLYKSEYDRVRLKEYSRFHGYAYDGIWTIAMAIQAVDKKLRMRNSARTIEDFHYRDPFWSQLFREALNETSFDGVTVWKKNLRAAITTTL